MIVQFNGDVAIAVASAAGAIPLVQDSLSHAFRPARSLSEARRLVAIEPTAVTFQWNARVLIEAVRKTSLNLDCDLLAEAQAIPSPPVPPDVRDAIIAQVESQS